MTRLDDLERAIERISSDFPIASRPYVIRLASSGTSPRVYACHICDVSSSREEGGAYSITPRTATVYALDVSNGSPASGQTYVAALVDGVIVFRSPPTP